MDYSFHHRLQNVNWSFVQIDNLLRYAVVNKNSSFVLYSAFECRNIIERIEFEIIVMTSNSSFGIKEFEDIKKRNGIKDANSKFSALKYRYQTFTESFIKAVLPELSMKPFNFKEAELIKTNLSQYIHIYSRMDEELIFNSSYIESGIHCVNSAIDFLKSYLIKDTEGYCFVNLDFMTIEESMRIEFQNWLKSNEQNNEALTIRLKKLLKA